MAACRKTGSADRLRHRRSVMVDLNDNERAQPPTRHGGNDFLTVTTNFCVFIAISRPASAAPSCAAPIVPRAGPSLCSFADKEKPPGKNLTVLAFIFDFPACRAGTARLRIPACRAGTARPRIPGCRMTFGRGEAFRYFLSDFKAPLHALSCSSIAWTASS